MHTSGKASALSTEFGPWNPGISSELPRELLKLSTIFRTENVLSTAEYVLEANDFTGLDIDTLVAFRPERLVVHELLLRVTADLAVPDGPRVEDLGINFRNIVDVILKRYVNPHMSSIVDAYRNLDESCSALIESELRVLSSTNTRARATSQSLVQATLAKLFSGRTRTASENEPRLREDIAREWQAKSATTTNPLHKAAYRALFITASAVQARRGRLETDCSLLAQIARSMACNDYGSSVVRHLVEQHVRVAVQNEGYRLLPAQKHPTIMNTKGASSAGKSSMRPLQRMLAGRLGLPWSEFAVISPDIWRKCLLDYSILGRDYKYAAALTARELAIVDQKLDRYMAGKAQLSGISHLVIDRFRFDSYAPSSSEVGSNLLTRFGQLVYMFFVITPPEATVERSWKRGLEVGRYKAVDDLLAHNVEAYSGMPELFFTWALSRNKAVHYEFLDNSVAIGDKPRTVAFGSREDMNVLDVTCMLSIDRYRKINVGATDPSEVYPSARAMAADVNAGFLTECVRRLRAVNFAEYSTGEIYARTENGKLVWTNSRALARALSDHEARAGLLAVLPDLLSRASTTKGCDERKLSPDGTATLGRWGAQVQ